MKPSAVLDTNSNMWRGKVFSSARTILVLLMAAILCLLLPGAATAYYYEYSSSTVETVPGVYADIQNYKADSNETVDGDNYAKSFVKPIGSSSNTLDGGAAVSNSSYYNMNHLYKSYTSATYGDTWTCVAGCSTASSPASSPDALILAFHMGGITASLNSGGSLGFDYQISSTAGSYDLFFRFNEDGEPGTVNTSAGIDNYDSSGFLGTTPLSPTVTITGSIVSFSLDGSFVASVGNVFSDQLEIGARVYNEPTTSDFVNAYDTFTVGITSDDPNIQFTSDGGRSTATPISTPEPSTLLLLGSGLAGLGGIVWRRQRK